ncbi:transposase [Bacillus cereus group sp. BfR-BA-01349]|uniref:transposase n=1 Tax=Bacillus cereus group sp. BfR-BA-01349 TaxID=2920312 RepID=UPI001F58A840
MLDKNKITKVCIDDFAIKKRRRYGTIMVDIETHKIIDLIPSRDLEDVLAWLKTFPNLKIVFRDGSITFRNAIAQAHPAVIQISDRFHLIQNLTGYIKQAFQRLLPNLIKVSHLSENQVHPAYQFLTLQEKISLAQKNEKRKHPHFYACETIRDGYSYTSKIHHLIKIKSVFSFYDPV